MINRKLLTAFLICAVVLCSCGKEEPLQEPEQNIVITEEEESERYEAVEIYMPDSLQPENAEGTDYAGDEFSGVVSDPQGKPAVYYNNFSIEGEEYFETLTRWTLTEANDWKQDELCENSLSEFLNQKYEQIGWKWFKLNQFRRGDDGSLYGIFTYCVKEVSKGEEGEESVDTEMETQKYSVLQIDEENDQIFEIPLVDFVHTQEVKFRLEEDFASGIDLTNYHIFEDGNVLLIYTESGGEYGKIVDGETGQTLTELGNIVNGRKRFAFGESEIIFFSSENKQFRVLGIPELTEDNTFGSQLSEEVSGKEWHYYTNPDTWELFLCNETGVYSAVSYLDSDDMVCLTQNTDLSELSQVTMGEENILNFMMGEDSGFYICLTSPSQEYGVEANKYRLLYYKKV